jgi:hypothetical protein
VDFGQRCLKYLVVLPKVILLKSYYKISTKPLKVVYLYDENVSGISGDEL